MEARGGYGRNSRVQESALTATIAQLEHAARDVAIVAPPAALTVADYGAASGHNSLLPMATAIRVLRQRIGTQRAINVVHNDVPASDFSGLFDTLARDCGSYMHGDPNIFPAAVGRSFFGQILPHGSVTLGWSSWAAQWLSRTPAPVRGHVYVAYSDDAEARAAFARQAAQDWRDFLAARSAELAPGGQMVVLLMASTDAGETGYRLPMQGVQAALQDLQDAGVISAADNAAMAVPTYFRTLAELRAPFDAAGLFQGLKLLSAGLFEAEDRIWLETGQGRNAEAFGERWAGFMRASIGPSLAAVLPEARRPAFLNALETALARRVAAAPEPAFMPLATVVLART